MSRANTAGRACAQHNRVLDIQPDVPGSVASGSPVLIGVRRPGRDRFRLLPPDVPFVPTQPRRGPAPPSGGDRVRFRDRFAVNTRYPAPLSRGRLAGGGGPPPAMTWRNPCTTTTTPPAPRPGRAGSGPAPRLVSRRPLLSWLAGRSPPSPPGAAPSSPATAPRSSWWSPTRARVTLPPA